MRKADGSLIQSDYGLSQSDDILGILSGKLPELQPFSDDEPEEEDILSEGDSIGSADESDFISMDKLKKSDYSSFHPKPSQNPVSAIRSNIKNIKKAYIEEEAEEEEDEYFGLGGADGEEEDVDDYLDDDGLVVPTGQEDETVDKEALRALHRYLLFLRFVIIIQNC